MKLWTDGRTTEPAYTISSHRAFGSGELKKKLGGEGGGGVGEGDGERLVGGGARESVFFLLWIQSRGHNNALMYKLDKLNL